MTLLVEQNIQSGEKEYTLRLSFTQTRDIERSIGKSLLHINHSAYSENAIAMAIMADITPDEAYQVIIDEGLPLVTVAIKTLILETFNPGKKSATAKAGTKTKPKK